jgi:hypothetical protein
VRVSDNYQSVIRGVSEQVPHDRIPGQHWDQDNMTSDPVRGLSRRHGSVQRYVMSLPFPITDVERKDASCRAEHTVFLEGGEWAFMPRNAPAPGSRLPPLILVDKDGQNFMEVVYDSPATEAQVGEGITSVTAAGRLVLLSSAKYPVETTVTKSMDATSDKHCVWVRGGGYSRSFSVTVASGNDDTMTYVYKTMTSYYEGTLDTTTIPWTSDGSYQKKVNDATNAYNSKVNQHIAKSAADITPENIAKRLWEQMEKENPGMAELHGAYILITKADTVVTVDDGGNGEYIRVTSLEVTAPELVTAQHLHGKVVKVVPKQAGALPYYLKAEGQGHTSFGDVIWRETAGDLITMDWVFFVGIFDEGKLWLAKSPAELGALRPALTIPNFSQASSGDSESNPRPEFFEKVITHMRMFQDRLMIVSGSTVFLSKSGDYFNFFRKSVLTLGDDDPIEVFAQGTEDDVITSGVQIDRNVVLCGQRFQYMVPGREMMTPKNPYIGVQATYEGANIVPHTSAGSVLFFCQRRERRLTLQRMQPAVMADRLDAMDASSQLDGYLTGTPRQLVSMTAPGAVFLRTQELTNGFYVYSWLDSEDNSERLFDSWSRWTFSAELGVLAGITVDDSGLLAVTLRDTKDGPALVLDRFTRETAPSELPYFDSITTLEDSNHVNSGHAAAFGAASENYLLGLPLANVSQLVEQFPGELGELYVGAEYDSHFTLTSPYVRDRNDKIILDARVTISKLVVSLSNSAAMRGSVSTDMGKTWKVSKSWVSRKAGSWVLNTQNIAEEETVTIPVMKENKAYRCRISSRSWLPMTVASVEWTGQMFTSRR